MKFDCYKDIELNVEQICTSEDVAANTCSYVGAYEFSEYELEMAYSTSCEGFSDYYSSCRNLKKVRKKALNAEDQRAYYDGKEDPDGGYCRRWIGDDEEYWKIEELEESRDCEAYAEYVFGDY